VHVEIQIAVAVFRHRFRKDLAGLLQRGDATPPIFCPCRLP
jgi:hypothetical protein